MRRMSDVDLQNKRVIIRVDFNVPISDGQVTNSKRIAAALPTIQFALNKGAAVILISHLGRPVEGEIDPALSLAPVAQPLAELLGLPVRFIAEGLNADIEVAAGEVVLCENVRFAKGEKSNDAELAKRWAQAGEVFVMDAFASAHRAHASTVGITQYIAQACAGLLLQAEIEALSQAMQQPKAPVVAIVGGAKVSTKLTILQALLPKVDYLIVGGGIANTFLAAQGIAIGQSLHEKDLIPEAQNLFASADSQQCQIVLPSDVQVATQFAKAASATLKSVDAIANNEMILDVGPDSSAAIAQIIAKAGTIIWNGPLGVFEFPAFAQGTQALAQAIATSNAYSLAGGGDTLAAIDTFAIADKISYISTGGGAFLEYLEGHELPGIAALA